MFKLCGEPACKPLDIIYKTWLESGKFPSEWKKAKAVPVHKKEIKELLRIIPLILSYQFA